MPKTPPKVLPRWRVKYTLDGATEGFIWVGAVNADVAIEKVGNRIADEVDVPIRSLHCQVVDKCP